MATENGKAENGKAPTFSIEDRVRQIGAARCTGVVKEIREEVTSSQGQDKSAALMVKVLWDNGTFSYFAPAALEHVK